MRKLRLAALGLVVAAAACSSKTQSTPPDNDICKTSQALTNGLILGTSIGAKQLALTFDDGPASRTGELSTYLKDQGIRAGFFVNGQFLAGGPGVLPQLVADGHVVANHTQTHPALSSLNASQMVNELTLTDTIIAPYVQANRFMFRAPFGDYNGTVYNALQASAMSKYVGHIEWDIGGQRTPTTAADFACWQNMPLLTAKACGDLYIQEIDAVGKGIVLMHDADYGPAGNNDPNTGTGNTVIMVKYMVPLLKAKGYTFVRIDEVPEISALLPPLPPPPDAGTDGSTTTPPPPPPPPPPDPCP